MPCQRPSCSWMGTLWISLQISNVKKNTSTNAWWTFPAIFLDWRSNNSPERKNMTWKPWQPKPRFQRTCRRTWDTLASSVAHAQLASLLRNFMLGSKRATTRNSNWTQEIWETYILGGSTIFCQNWFWLHWKSAFKIHLFSTNISILSKMTWIRCPSVTDQTTFNAGSTSCLIADPIEVRGFDSHHNQPTKQKDAEPICQEWIPKKIMASKN